MECIISDGRSFITKTHGTAMTREVVIESVWNEKTNFRLSRDKYDADIEEGDIASMRTYCGVVTGVKTDKLTADVECEHISVIFDREIPYTERPEGGNIEAWIKAQIDLNFTDQSDEYCRLPNLVVIAETDTASDLEPDAENGVWNIKNFLAKVRRIHNIHTTFEMKKASLVVRIKRQDVVVKNLLLSDRSIKLLEEAYSSDYTAKVTVQIESLKGSEWEFEDWYLLEDGTITDDPEAERRVDGKWVRITVAKVRDIQGAVQEAFDENEKSHKIRFSVPERKARYDFYDQIRVEAKGKVFYSHIAAIKIKKGSTQVEYQCGQMRTKLTDKLREDL